MNFGGGKSPHPPAPASGAPILGEGVPDGFENCGWTVRAGKSLRDGEMIPASFFVAIAPGGRRTKGLIGLCRTANWIAIHGFVFRSNQVGEWVLRQFALTHRKREGCRI